MIRRAFTLIEMLVVLAITAVVLGLILGPIFFVLNQTKTGAAFAEAQTRARTIGENIAREIEGATGVRDNAGPKGVILVDPLNSSKSLDTTDLTAGGESQTMVPLQWAKVDLVVPAQGDNPAPGPSGGYIDPGTGLEDPTLKAPKGQIVLPVAPGSTVVRYWIGLRDPFSPYSNSYNTLLGKGGGGRNNLYVLWRAEVSPLVYDSVAKKFVVNRKFFFDSSRIHVNSAPAAPTPYRIEPSAYQVVGGTGPLFDDPAFFDPFDQTYSYNTALPGDVAKADMVRNWVSAARIVSDVDTTDLIQPVYEKGTQKLVYDGPAPRILPLIQFKPTHIASESAEGQVAVRQGEESDNAALIGPDTYRTQYGLWSNQIVRTYPSNWDQTIPAKDAYLVGRRATGKLGLSIFRYSPSVDGTSVELTGGVELFDVNAYVNAQTAYPFSEAVAAANSRSGWQTSANLASYLANFIAYFPDASAGKLIASFGIDEFGDSTKTPTVPYNLPTAATALSQGPLQDSGSGATYSPADTSATYDVNRCFNRAWYSTEGQSIRPDVHRFIDLRVTPQSDGTPSPLPLNLASTDANVKFHYPRAMIVPGSEQIYGPDQQPGPHYGLQILYSRTTRKPGPNQYRINYTDQVEPDYALLGLTAPPATYDATSFMSAVFQARYKAGYVQLNSDPNIPLPINSGTGTGVFRVYYRVQFTQPKDAFAVEYDSRQLLSVLLTVKNFPQQGYSTSQNVTIPVTAKVRNFLR